MIWIIVSATVVAAAMVTLAAFIPTGTAPALEASPLAELPAMPADADPVIIPGLLRGLGLTRPQVPPWMTDPDLIASIEAGLMELPDDFAPTTERRAR